MSSTVSPITFERLFFSPAISFKEDSEILDELYQIENDHVSGVFRELAFKDFGVKISELDIKKKTDVNISNNSDSVSMYFNLKGFSSFRINEPKRFSVDFIPNRHNIIYIPGTDKTVSLKEEELRTMEINLSLSVFEEYLQGLEEHGERFAKLINNGEAAKIGVQNPTITPEMAYVINAISTCERKGTYKKLFLKSKILEILLLQIEQLDSFDFCGQCSLKRKDIEKIYHAREIVHCSYNDPCPLIELAKLVGTNEFTLKKGFKEIFGITVFGLVFELKMEKAKKLLLETDLSIAEISDKVGYQHQSHFSKAFKKKFGVSPSEFVK